MDCKLGMEPLWGFNAFLLPQVCDSDTMLDPACSVEMVKVLEEDPMVGGVGGDVQVPSPTKASSFKDTQRLPLEATKHCHIYVFPTSHKKLLISTYQFIPDSEQV